MNTTFTVRFWSEHLESPEYIGPFFTEQDAQDYADDRNSSLALSGIPSSVACYSVVDWLMMIETDFFILTQEQYDQFSIDAQKLNLSLDYFLLEFCDVIGPVISSN